MAQEYRARTGDDTPCVVLSTASPYKFPASVLEALGENVPEDVKAQIERLEKRSGSRVPAALEGVLTRPVRFREVVAPEGMMDYVLGKVAAQ